jgi:hypothetical protein
VFLRRGWAKHILPITRLRVNRLELLRPAAVDLVLAKMVRGNDEQDTADAEFLNRHGRIAETQLLAAFSQMNLLDLAEFCIAALTRRASSVDSLVPAIATGASATPGGLSLPSRCIFLRACISVTACGTVVACCSGFIGAKEYALSTRIVPK